MTEKIGNLGAWLMVFGCAIGITSCQTETKETTGKGYQLMTIQADTDKEITSPNIKYIDNQLVTVIKIQMICKCKYKTI